MSPFNTQIFLIIISLICITAACQTATKESTTQAAAHPESLLVHIVDPAQTDLAFYYKNEKGENYANHQSLKTQLAKNNKSLIFAVNGGMYNRDHTPQGLYIEKGIKITPLDTISEGYGNFYLQPNGIFYLTNDRKAQVIQSDSFVINENISFATQSGPMLLIDGEIHPKFRAGSANLHIRNGVGVLPDGRTLFVMSKEKINFYDLATYFKKQGCRNALYLDGFVSRTYLPAQNWEQSDGNFGVFIGEISSR